MNFATIDVGSNSILLYIAEKRTDGKFSLVYDSSEITRLGEGLSTTGVLSESAIERSLVVIKHFVEQMKKYNVSDYAAVGTMALRTAKNASVFIKNVREKCGIEINVISGDEEARLSYLAVKSGMELGSGTTVIFDVGGGSTEFILGEGDNIIKKFSINLGTIRFTEKYFKSDPVTPDELKSAEDAIKEEIKSIELIPGVLSLVGIGGTVTNITSVMHKFETYDPDIAQSSIITYEEILRQIALYSGLKLEERKKIIGLQPKRADVIISGALIIKNILGKTGLNSFRASDKGIRHGLMLDKFGG
ncbi:MAG TPA: Ppx/GppA phosphatase family protein [Ignavibacteria bacterium]